MRSTAQTLALVLGIVFLLVGLAGLLVPGGMSMNAEMETSGRLLGLFPVNLLHNIVHIAFGAWGILASRTVSATRTYGRTGTVIYVVLVVLAFVDPTTFGLVPIGSHAIWLHAILAAALAYVGFASPAATVTA